MAEKENYFVQTERKDKSRRVIVGGSYTVAQQTEGFRVKEQTVTTGLSGIGKVKEVKASSVYKGGTIG